MASLGPASSWGVVKIFGRQLLLSRFVLQKYFANLVKQCRGWIGVSEEGRKVQGYRYQGCLEISHRVYKDVVMFDIYWVKLWGFGRSVLDVMCVSYWLGREAWCLWKLLKPTMEKAESKAWRMFSHHISTLYFFGLVSLSHRLSLYGVLVSLSITETKFLRPRT